MCYSHGMKNDATLNLRVPAELKMALERAAEADLRTVSGMAVVLLVEGMKRRGFVTPARKKGKR